VRDLAELGEVLGLPAPPLRIEGFDISNISGTFAVASMVRFKNGRPDRANYRRFKIKTVTGQDDFASMAEVVRRRYTRLLSESKARTPQSKDEGGEAIPDALQELVDDVSAAKRRQRIKPTADASAEAVRLGQAPGDHPTESMPESKAVEMQPVAEEIQPDAPEDFDEAEELTEQPAGAEVSADAPGSESRLQAVPDRLKPELRTNLPDLILIDGGKGQLGMAVAELKSLDWKISR